MGRARLLRLPGLLAAELLLLRERLLADIEPILVRQVSGGLGLLEERRREVRREARDVLAVQRVLRGGVRGSALSSGGGGWGRGGAGSARRGRVAVGADCSYRKKVASEAPRTTCSPVCRPSVRSITSFDA